MERRLSRGPITVVIFLSIVLIVGLLGWLILDRGASTERLAQLPSSSNSLRLISLSPNITETIYAIGAESVLVGVTDCCDWPSAVKEKPVVGTYGFPNVERLIAANPTDILTTERLSPDQLRAFESVGIRVHTFRIGDVESIYRMFRGVGRITRRDQSARQLERSLEAEFASAREMIRHRFAVPPRLFCELWNDPLTTIGRESFLTDVLERIGAENVASEIRMAYPVINAERVFAWDPDGILVIHMMPDGSTDVRSELSSRIGWDTLRAIQTGMVITDLPEETLLRPGPRMGQGAILIAKRITGVVE